MIAPIFIKTQTLVPALNLVGLSAATLFSSGVLVMLLCILRSHLPLLSCAAPSHKTDLIVVCEIEAADSLESKRSNSNFERSDALPAIVTIILASFRVLYIAPLALPSHVNCNIDV